MLNISSESPSQITHLTSETQQITAPQSHNSQSEELSHETAVKCYLKELIYSILNNKDADTASTVVVLITVPRHATLYHMA